MENLDYTLFDPRRILLGNAPLFFLLESFLRTTVVYAFLLIVLRLLGKRMSSQATISELAVMLMLGAIIAMPIESADRGVLPGMLLLVVALSLQKLIGTIGVKKAAKLPVGTGVSALVRDGVLQLHELAKEKLSQEQIFAILRLQNVVSLGEVERLYYETTGGFSLYKRKKPKPGLCIFPNDEVGKLFADRVAHDQVACSVCGRTDERDRAFSCACISEARSAVI